MENGIGTVAEANILCNLCSVDVVNGDVVLREVTLYLVRYEVHQLVALEYGVEQERAVLLQSACNVIHVEVCLYVASHEVRRVNQVCAAYWRVTEAEVRAGEAARLLRVIREVSLAVLVGVVADDFHGVLVCSDCTVSSKSVELGLEHAFASESHFLNLGQRGERYVVNYTNGEVVFRLVELQVVEYGDDCSRRCVVRAKAVTSADYERLVLHVVVSALHVEVQGLAFRARFLRSVEYGDALHGCRN